jgi:hypothetical protein
MIRLDRAHGRAPSFLASAHRALFPAPFAFYAFKFRQRHIHIGPSLIDLSLALQHNYPPSISPIPRFPSDAVMSSDAFQVCFHPKLGVVINDPIAQMGLAREQMRLFKLGAMGASTFLRAIVSKDLVACTEDQLQAHATAIETYRTARSSRRKPYCEQCRRHFGSVDFSVCGDCHSIRCTCGTCSCASSSRRRKAA